MLSQPRSLLYLLLLSGVLHIGVLYFVRLPVTKMRPHNDFHSFTHLRLQEVRDNRVEERVESPSTVPPPASQPKALVKPPEKKPLATASSSLPANKPVAPPATTPTLSVPVITSTSEKSTGPSVTPEELALSSEQITKQKLDKALGVEDILSNAKRSVGKIDKDLRAEVVAPARAALLGREGPSKFSQAIANAGIPRTTQGEVIYGPGGQQYTKFRGPNGTFCVWKLKLERAAGQGILEDPGIQVTSCPN